MKKNVCFAKFWAVAVFKKNIILLLFESQNFHNISKKMLQDCVIYPTDVHACSSSK